MTISVWVLVLVVWGFAGGGPAVIDNIASKEECERVRRTIASQHSGAWQSQCVEVVKVRQ